MSKLYFHKCVYNILLYQLIIFNVSIIQIKQLTNKIILEGFWSSEPTLYVTFFPVCKTYIITSYKHIKAIPTIYHDIISRTEQYLK